MIHTMSEDDFHKMMANNSYEVKVISIKDTDPKKLKFQTGIQREVTYKDGEVGGKTIPNYTANVAFNPVFKEKIVPQRLVEFEFTNEKYEKAYLESFKDMK